MVFKQCFKHLKKSNLVSNSKSVLREITFHINKKSLYEYFSRILVLRLLSWLISLLSWLIFYRL